MLFSRRLLPRTKLHLRIQDSVGLLQYVSINQNGNLHLLTVRLRNHSYAKKSAAAKEQRAAVVESYVKEYMETHPGVFPKTTLVQNKVGGSWYILKNILAELKEKMLRNPQFRSTSTHERSNSTVNARAAENTNHNPHSTEPKGIVHSSDSVLDSNSNEKVISTSTTSHIVRGNSSVDVVEVIRMGSCTDGIEPSEHRSIVRASEILMDSFDNDKSSLATASSSIMVGSSSRNVIDTTASQVSKTRNNSDNTYIGETESIIQSSEAVMDFQNNENTSLIAPSKQMGESSSEYVEWSDDLLDSSKVGEPENWHRQPEESKSCLLGGHDRKQKSESEQLFCLTRQLLTEASIPLGNDGVDIFTPGGNENLQSYKNILTSKKPNAGSEASERLASPVRSPEVKGLAYLFNEAMNDKVAKEMTDKNTIFTPIKTLENSNEISGEYREYMAKSCDIKDLIKCIKDLPTEQSINKSKDDVFSIKTDEVSNRGSCRSLQSWANWQKSDNMAIQALNKHFQKFNYGKEKHNTEITSKAGDTRDLNVAAFDHIKSEPSPRVRFATSKERPKNTPGKFSTDEGTSMNKLLVRFLNKHCTVDDISAAFEDCGPIAKIHQIPPIEEIYFRYAYVCFQTRKGLQKALEKTDLLVRTSDAIVEPISSLEHMPNQIMIPKLIGDPDVPIALVKNPNRTIMIKRLSHSITSRHLKEALSFCGGSISGCFFGSSSSVVYVEFETEDAKDKAIAKHSISVLGKQLSIFRIDAPRTTVLRISNISYVALPNMRSILNSYGKLKRTYQRTKDTVDAYFMLVEWPNMLNILNSLNGKEIDGSRLVAEPAPIFPPNILQILWRDSDGRRHVKAVMRSLLQKLEENTVDKTGLTNYAVSAIVNDSK